FFGHDAAALGGSNVLDLVVAEERAIIAHALDALRARGHTTYEHALITASGQRRWVAWSSCLLGEGNAGGRIVSTGIDRSREREAFRELRASQHQHRELVCISADAHVRLDEDPHIT